MVTATMTAINPDAQVILAEIAAETADRQEANLRKQLDELTADLSRAMTQMTTAPFMSTDWVAGKYAGEVLLARMAGINDELNKAMEIADEAHKRAAYLADKMASSRPRIRGGRTTMCNLVATRTTVKRADGSNITGKIAVAIFHGLLDNAAGPNSAREVEFLSGPDAVHFDKTRLHLNSDGRVECKVRVGPDTWLRVGYFKPEGVYNAEGTHDDEGVEPADVDAIPVGVRDGEEFNWGDLSDEDKVAMMAAAQLMLAF